MNMIANEFLAVNPLRLANDFLAGFTINHVAVLGLLRVELNYMDAWQAREWRECLGELLVEEECTPELWQAIFESLEAMELIESADGRIRMLAEYRVSKTPNTLKIHHDENRV